MNAKQFVQVLIDELPKSSATTRRNLTKQIIENQYAIETLSVCLKKDLRVASRFSWLLSDLGEYNKAYLRNALPFLWKKSEEITHTSFKRSFVKYWLVAGIPEEQEGHALDLSFQLLNDDELKVGVKSWALSLLFQLTKKHPEIIPELRTCMEHQMNRNTNAFKHKCKKLLAKLSIDT